MWTTPPLHAVGDVLTASDWNIASNDLTFLYNRTQGERVVYISYVSGTGFGVTFPTPFPTSCDSVIIAVEGVALAYYVLLTLTGSGFTAKLYSGAGEFATGSYVVDWIVIGH